MHCKNCGAVISGGNFCTYCGEPVGETTSSISLLNKAVSTAADTNQYNLVLVSCGSCNKTQTGDLLEDIFGYTDAESTNLINMAPVVVGERLNANEARTVAQLLTEYGVQVSITNQSDQYVDLTSQATTSVFDKAGNLLSGVAAIIGALTVGNRISSYRRYKKPSLLERIFHVGYRPEPPAYRRNFRPPVEKPAQLAPRRTIRTPERPRPSTPVHSGRPDGHGGMQGGHGGMQGGHGGGHTPGRR
ncbi:MAG: zinc ribbon domain-containing protein [Clostridia bacterium]|nr:zinc ribbon domain-containing protein [Clostridia bacterium]